MLNRLLSVIITIYIYSSILHSSISVACVLGKRHKNLCKKNTKLETNSGLLIVKIILDISALNLAYLVGGGGIEITIKEEG